MTNIIFGVWLALIVLSTLYSIAKNIGIRSSSPRWKWIRRYYWREAQSKIIDGDFKNWKVQSYFVKYLRGSLAAKQHFINHGWVETRHILVGKMEELERFVEKYQFNTFERLNPWEEDFINKWEKENRRNKS